MDQTPVTTERPGGYDKIATIVREQFAWMQAIRSLPASEPGGALIRVARPRR